MHCPKCGSHSLIRSHSRGLEKIPRALLGRRTYKCRKCDWRGGKIVATEKQKRRILYFVIMIVLAVIVTLVLISYFGRPPVFEELTP